MRSEANLTYAPNQDGKLVHVDSVPNGNACGCVCIKCNSPLCAKNGGDKRTHHFAHLNGTVCEDAFETTLHKMAKDVLLKTKRILLPKRNDGQDDELVVFDRVESEVHDKETGLCPDCIGYKGNSVIWVEFKVSHPIDRKKKEKIISAHIECIEIDLNGCQLDPIEIEKFLTNTSEKRVWIRDDSDLKRNAGTLSAYNKPNIINNPLLTNRHFAKDENGRLVDIRKDDINMDEHSYLCLGCDRKLKIGVGSDNSNIFEHVDKEHNCDNYYYLHEAAKEIICYKFYNSNEFIISMSQYQKCENSSSCVFYKEGECDQIASAEYDLKEYGYKECLKDFRIPNLRYNCDIVIKKEDTLDNAIIINIIADKCNKYVDSKDYRMIELNILHEPMLDTLLRDPIKEFKHIASFNDKFKKDTDKRIASNEINREIERFELFSSGKYYLDKIHCSELDKRKRSTVYEILFDDNENTFSREEKIIYSLVRCYKEQIKACYCEICHFLSRPTENLAKSYCRYYKTKGTPKHPLKENYMDCEHFRMDYDYQRLFDVISKFNIAFDHRL